MYGYCNRLADHSQAPSSRAGCVTVCWLAKHDGFLLSVIAGEVLVSLVKGDMLSGISPYDCLEKGLGT